MWRLDLPITERQVTFLWSRTASRFLTVKTGAKKKPRGFGTAAKPENRGPVKSHSRVRRQEGTQPNSISPSLLFQAPRPCNRLDKYFSTIGPFLEKLLAVLFAQLIKVSKRRIGRFWHPFFEKTTTTFP
jgi:hypothetical protein